MIFNFKCTSCGRGPSSELTPAASAASLGHERLRTVVRDARFARYCEDKYPWPTLLDFRNYLVEKLFFWWIIFS